ncbi:SGNH/GDSL hydrolase family protein [Sphingobium yanoikuyae]|uniref:SGNH hydrolase-type esterase domain-containing protein n=1 Tax=Sphingobium yanoikuyae TaxID=13690 RepID=A0A9X7YDC2_SPHYA|nr:SGNH/GDSL hydrolase family protein [Sphingobium yanoikuyae]QNG46148.1 hypothetical protein H3V42_00220 [Sphingobium yanoikuyae]
MALDPMGYTAANRRTVKLMVEQAAPLFEDGSAPMFMNMATAVIEVAVGKLFYAIAPIGDPNAGKKRLFLRVNTAPYYEDQGDAAAPGSQAQIDAAAALNQAAVEAVEARQDDVEFTLSGALSSSSYRPTPADGADLPIDTYFLAPNAGDTGAVWVYRRVDGAPGYLAIHRQEFSADQIADGEAKVSMTAVERVRLSEVSQNLSAQTIAGRTVTPTAGTSALGGRTSAVNAPRAVRERCFKIEVQTSAAGTIKVNRQTRSDTTMTVVESIVVAVVAGLNTLTEAQLGSDFWFNPGDYLGFDHPNGILDATSTSTDSVGYYTAVGSLTTYEAASPNAGRIEVRGFFTSQAVTKASQDALSGRIDANANTVALVSAITARGLGDSTRIGRQSDAVAATANTSRTYYLPSAARANDGYLSELRVWANAAGTVAIKVGTSDGTNINQVTSKAVRLAAGLNVLTPSDFGVIPVAASAFVGIYTPIGVVGVTASSTDSVGYYTAVGDVASVPLSSLTTLRLEIAYRVQQYGASAQDTPLARWKRNYRGLEQPPKLMSVPPTLTIGAADAVSAITGAANAAVNVGRDDARLTKVGATFTDTLSVYKNAAYSGARIRFKLAGSKFEMRLFTGSVGRGVSVKVDGEYIRTSPWPAGMLDSTNHLALVDFGTNALTYTGIDVYAIGNGGSGYIAGDIITLAGGTFTVPMRIIVTKVASGVITGAKIYDPGSYTAVPAHGSNMAQASATGAGTGAQIRPIWTKRLSTKKMREIEITLDAGTRFGGLNIEANATLLPWPEQAVYGRWMIVGDSYTSHAQCDHPAANYAAQLACKLGVHDAYWRVGYSGIGWIIGGPTNVGIDDLTSYVTGNAPDVVVVFMGGNDETFGSSTASVQAKVTSWGNAVHAALPNVKLVIVPAWTCGAAVNSAILAGAAAIADQARVRSIDIRTRDIYTNDGTGEDFRSTDDNHPGQPGMDYLAQAVAPFVAAAVQEMV